MAASFGKSASGGGTLGSVTLDQILLKVQAKAGIRNCQNTLVISDLFVEGPPVAVEIPSCGNSDAGMISLIDASLETARGEAAIVNAISRSVSANGCGG